MSFHFYKMQGCGNDFLFLDAMKQTEPLKLGGHEIIQLCDRHFGIGADGLVVLQSSRAAHAKWQFYNCDGSEAEMCGNAARCAILFLSDKYFPTEPLLALETRAGIIKGRKIHDGLIEITLFSQGNLEFEVEEKVLKTDDDVFRLYCLDTGVPHAVLEVKDIFSFPISRVGRTILHHPAFAPKGTNVTFFQKSMGQVIYSTTFERGVEKETFACGTGVAAAAIVYSQLYLEALPIEVVVPGGSLFVDRSPASKMWLLQGPATYVMEAQVPEWDKNFEPKKLFEGLKTEVPSEA